MGFSTTNEIKQAVLSHCGELTNGNSPFDARVVDYINRAYVAILAGSPIFSTDLGDPFQWAKAPNPGIIVLKAPHETGTVSLTNGVNTGSFSVAPTTSMLGRYLKIADRPEYFRFTAHTSGFTPFALDSVYTDETGSALSYKAHKLDYTLAGMLRLIEPMRVYRAQNYEGDNVGKIEGTSSEQITRDYPLHLLESGTPTRFAVMSEASGGIYTVRFNKTVDRDTRVEYDYIPVPTTLTASPDLTPVIPLEDREVLIYGASYFLLVDKSDNRKDEYLNLTRAKMSNMLVARRREDIQSGKNVGRLMARQEDRAPHVLRSASGLRY